MKDLAWLKAALKGNRQGMENAGLYLQLWNKEITEDLIAVLQTGLMVLLDKPAYFIIPPGAVLPENLRRLARGVLEVDMSTEAGRVAAAEWTKGIAAAMRAEARRLGQEDKQ